MNMVGQVILAIVFSALLRILGWIAQGVPALSFLGLPDGIFYGLLPVGACSAWS
jgi:hypothetical protein